MKFFNSMNLPLSCDLLNIDLTDKAEAIIIASLIQNYQVLQIFIFTKTSNSRKIT